jgi:RHS repeat-associated protein
MKKLLTLAIGLSVFLTALPLHAAFYLHGTGPNANPPTLFLDNIAPTATTEKYRDSTGVNFSGGNLWKEIGTWEVTASGTLTELNNLHVWLGLKNSDDIGTRFDLRAEVYKNGQSLVTSGELYCIQNITRNPALAKEVVVSFSSFSPVTFLDLDTISLRIFTRIGTNGDGTFCGGHSNAVGLRLYFDATDRPARFDATFLQNLAPVANAGQDQQVRVGDIITLDGRNSYDPDGDLITYAWAFTEIPSGSTASLTNPASVMPFFVPDIPGNYIVALTVNDGQIDSSPDDVVVIAAYPNVAPTAIAGPDQSVVTGSQVHLDGQGSFDPDGNPLTYQWQIISLPEGSTASLDNPASPTPIFLADQVGQYVIELTVNDGWLNSFPDDVVVISATPNAPPVAFAGDDQTVSPNTMISLNASGSYDPDNNPLSYNWSIISRPEGSTSQLDDPASPTPTILADSEGEYVFRLVVYDGQLYSDPSTVVIRAAEVIPPNQNPVANPGGPYAGVVDASVQFDGSGSSDPDGDPITFTWDFGDGATGSGVTPTHTYSSVGTYTVTLTVDDGRGGGNTAQTTAEIVNPSPSLSSIDPSSTTAGTPAFTLTLYGDNFGTTSIVSFSNEQYPSTFISKTQIETTIPSTAVASPGNYPVKVINPGPGGGETSILTFTVNTYIQPQPEGSFGEKYQDLVPPDATIQSYDPKRFSLVTGLVRNPGGSPINDVSVNILGRSEYGTAKTNAEGRFSVPVEGGGTLTITYRKEGLITTHRKVYVPWNDIAIAETIVMIQEDPTSTTLTFDGNPNTIIAHQSTIVTDDRGSRSSTLVFTGDTRAYSVDASGNVIQELTTITARATEFATEESMPAKLPPTSAYTYCVELGVDGAQRVRFDRPVIIWVDNFLGFNVGERVPVGYYDRDRGVWVPSDNGLVVRLLDTNSDGVVDALDANGDNQPDDLNGNGSFTDEVSGLNNPQRYAPGSNFWRFTVTHFTPWDCNWPIGPPPGAVSPNAQGDPEADQQKCEEDDCRRSASVIEERSRIIHEDIPIVGTPMTLHYASSRVNGFHQLITIPASGAAVPGTLKRIVVEASVAGRSFKQVLSSLPNQKVEFPWDGLDYLGRSVEGPAIVHINIGFVYDGIYYIPREIAFAFAQPGSSPGNILARQEVILWKKSHLVIHRFGKGNLGAEGWSLSTHHHLSSMDTTTLHKGDGTTARNDALIISRFAGTGNYGYSGDGGPATQGKIYYPRGIAIDPAGNVYIAEYGNDCIRKVDKNGIMTTVAGSGYFGYGYSGDGGPAIEAQLSFPYEVATDALGNIYIADNGNHRVRKVDLNGIITTVAGNGSYYGYGGDGGPATQADIPYPGAITVDPSGNLYIVHDARIRKVDPNGIITTIAGTGFSGFSGDGGPATQARLYSPLGIAADASGTLYIADTVNHRIRKIDNSGIITTVAGSGSSGYYGGGYSGDGGPATQALLYYPKGVAVDTLGNLYIADSDNHRIRKVHSNGIITTIAGNGDIVYGGDGGNPTEAQVHWPLRVVLDASGALYIVDAENHSIRKIGYPSVAASGMAIGDIPFFENNGIGYILDNAGRHKATVDLNTWRNVYTFGYDQDKRLTSVTDQSGNNTVIQRDPSGIPTTIISPDGIATTLTIDTNNHLTRISYPDGNFYSFEYTTDGLMTAKIEPEGNRFEHVFDLRGRLTDAIDQEGGNWQYSRSVDINGDVQTQVLSAEGNLTTYLDHTDSTGAYTSRITDPSGAETLYTRSADKLTATKTLPCGMNLTFKYGVDSQYKFQSVKEIRERASSGLEKITLRQKTYQDTNADKVPDLLTERVTINSKVTRLVTNTLQSKRTMTSPTGRTTTTFYDPNNLLNTKLQIPGLYDIDFAYDTRGGLTSITTNTRQTVFGYDSQGNLSCITDPENHTTNYTYDSVGRLTRIDRPDGTSIGFTYNKNGNMTVLTNPSTINHGFGYNQVNLNSSYQTPLSGSYNYLYNRDRRLLQINFPSGKQIKNVYDKDRLIQTQIPEGNIDLTYLCGSKVGSITKGPEIITYGYDGSLVTSETLSGTLNQVLNYTYNSDFNLSSLTYAGSTVNYSYDNDGLLIGAGAFSITRDAGNGLPEAVAGGTLNLTRTFNGYGELESENFIVNGNALSSWNLSRGNSGRIISKTETIEGTNSNYAYTYDSMGRLLTVTRDGTLMEEYQYDLVGRRSYEMNVLGGIFGRTFMYSDEDHLITAGDTAYQYNVDGFLTTKTQGTDVTTYNYSSLGELLNINLPDGTTIEYINDPLGRRIAKKVNGVIIEKYLWQGLTRLLAVYDGSNNLVMRFEYADARMPVVMNSAGANYYLTYDQVGSLRLVINASGNVIKRIDYDSFGNIINDTNPSFNVSFGFAGGLHDRDTGLVRFGFRDYDPETGRWTAKDPIFFGGRDIDLYGYVENNPINFKDPSGLQGGIADLGMILNHLAELGGRLYETTMAIGKRDYEFFKATGEHQPSNAGSAVNWSEVDWAKYDQGNFEDTIKKIIELHKQGRCP